MLNDDLHQRLPPGAFRGKSPHQFVGLLGLFRREKELRQIGVVTHNVNIPVNGDAEAIVALEAVGYVPESAIREPGRRSGLELDAVAVQKIFDLMPWPAWEQRVRRLLRDNVGAEDEDAEVVVTELGGVRRADGRVKVYQDVITAPCAGGLDTEFVKRAVQDVMEGSREAFERRREMYGF